MQIITSINQRLRAMFKPCIFFLLALLSSLRTETCIGSFLPNAKSSNGAVSPTMSEFPEIERENFLTMLSQKVSIVANIPIFEFGQDVTDFLKRAEDESGCVNPSTMIDLEIIFYDYMVKLRSYYFLIFSNFQSRTFLDGLQPIRMYLIEERDYCVGQCKKAMQSALPATIHTDLWSFQVRRLFVWPRGSSTSAIQQVETFSKANRC